MRTVTVLKTKVETKKTCMMLRSRYGFGNWLSGANDSTLNSFEHDRILPYYGRYCFKFLNLSSRSHTFKKTSHLKDKVWFQPRKWLRNVLQYTWFTYLVGSSELFTLYISGASHGMVRIVNPSNSRMAWLGLSIHSRILPYYTRCFKFLNLSSWTHSFNKN